MTDLFKVGDNIYGFCNGYFGRDDYDTKICVMVTKLYAVFQYTEGESKGFATILNYTDGIENCINDWKNDE